MEAAVAAGRMDEQAGRVHGVVDVRVTRASGGGWDVIAILGDRMLALQHCEDWHRVERACRLMGGDARPCHAEAA
jgi:hypothetical protein